MDKISKRSKGYAFIEYTTEEAASAALKEMNGKVSPLWIFLVFFLCVEKFRPWFIELISFKPKLLIRFIVNKLIKINKHQYHVQIMQRKK